MSFYGNIGLDKILIAAGFAGFGSIIGAQILRIATSMVAKFKPRYLNAYFVSFLSIFATQLILFFIGPFSQIFAGIVALPISSLFYGYLLKNPETGPIGFSKGLVISVFLYSLGLVLGLVFHLLSL